MNLYVKTEKHYIAVLNYVLLAFTSHFAFFFGNGIRAKFKQYFVINNLSLLFMWQILARVKLAQKMIM